MKNTMHEQTLCEFWDEVPSETKPYSRLYHLDPIGVGSPMVESLTSYIARLAEAHSVSPHTLLQKEIFPRVHLQSSNLSNYLSGFWTYSSSLNSVANSVGTWVKVLEQLTLCQGLRFLTLLPFAEILSSNGLLRRIRAWCPLCYEQWQEAGQIVYDPLLWAFEMITMCPKHGIALHQQCPNKRCARTLYPLTQRSQPGFCGACGWWLGINTREERKGQDDQEWQQWVSNAVEGLLATAPDLASPLTINSLIMALSKYAEVVAGGNLSAFARRVHLPGETVWTWLQGRRQTIQFTTLVQISACLDISPIDLLTGNLPTDRMPQISSEHKIPTKPSKTRRPMDKEYLKCALETVLQGEENPPPPMTEVGKRLGYVPSSLRPLFPDLCRAISQRYKNYQTAQRAERVRKLCDEVREAAYKVHAQGYYPSPRRIGEVIKTPGVLKAPEAQDTWRKVLRELGWGQETP